jgi:hypothetical protein
MKPDVTHVDVDGELTVTVRGRRASWCGSRPDYPASAVLKDLDRALGKSRERLRELKVAKDAVRKVAEP